MAKYIKNKEINLTKVNNVKKLQDIGEAAWKFVSAFYNVEWDLLIADVYNNSFRQKVSFHYIPKTNPVKNSKPKDKDIDKQASIKRLPPLISTKIPKKINKISKFFKTKTLAYNNGS